MSRRRQSNPGPARDEDADIKPRRSHSQKTSYGTRVNQLFQEAIRDLEALKRPPMRAKAMRAKPMRAKAARKRRPA